MLQRSKKKDLFRYGLEEITNEPKLLAEKEWLNQKSFVSFCPISYSIRTIYNIIIISEKDRFMLFILCECFLVVVEVCMFSNYTIKQFISSFLSLNGAMCLRMEVISYVIELLLFLPNILYQGDLNIPLFNLYMYTKYKRREVQHN